VSHCAVHCSCRRWWVSSPWSGSEMANLFHFINNDVWRIKKCRVYCYLIVMASFIMPSVVMLCSYAECSCAVCLGIMLFEDQILVTNFAALCCLRYQLASISAKKLSTTTLSIMTFSIVTLNITIKMWNPLSKMIFSIAEMSCLCRAYWYYDAMLSVVMLSVVMLSVVMLNVVILRITI
jgi:hypothetical protein